MEGVKEGKIKGKREERKEGMKEGKNETINLGRLKKEQKEVVKGGYKGV